MVESVMTRSIPSEKNNGFLLATMKEYQSVRFLNEEEFAKLRPELEALGVGHWVRFLFS